MPTIPANDNDGASIARHAQPITISSANCLALTGMSWSWVVRFARAHGVPIWRVGSRKQVIPGPQLAAAMEAANAAAGQAEPLTADDECARLEREFQARRRQRA